MKLSEVKEIIDCLPQGKTRFYYFKDRYALLLLSLFITGETSKKALRRSRLGGLLDKAVVKEAIQLCSTSELRAETFESYWKDTYECYFLTLGRWGSKYGGWEQTSRAGYNLVLQLNFSSAHDEPYRRWIDPADACPFSHFGHPIAEYPMHTLAWARLDIDVGRGEALIEEVQTDWVREALRARRRAVEAETSIQYYGVEIEKHRLIRYVDSILRRHEEIWDEAILAATIWFLREEIGVKTIFYHTYESGARLKEIRFGLPPRSVYSKLPKRFCFEETDQRPGFLPKKAKPSRANRRYDSARFLLLDLDRKQAN